jgi:hypothetical protein
MGFDEMDKDRQMLEYHSVFASNLAIYMNIRKELETGASGSMASTLASKKREALSIIRSNTLYAIILKRNDVENNDIPTTADMVDLIKWYNQLEKNVAKQLPDNHDALDAMYSIMVRKQEVAGLTANSEKTMTSKMNMLISNVESAMKKGR